MLLQRSFLVYSRDVSSFFGRILAAVVCAVILGLAFQSCGNDATKVYINTAYLAFLNMMSICPPIFTTIINGPANFKVILRENTNAWYTVTNYYWAKSLAELPFQLFISWIIPVSTWFLARELPPAVDSLLPVVFIIAMITVLAQGLGFMLGIVADEKSAVQIPFGVILLCWLFGGYVCTFTAMTVYLSWIHYIVFGFSSYWALLKMAYVGNPSIPCSFELHPLCQKFRSGYDVLNEYGVPLTSVWNEIAYIASYTVAIFLIGWLLLIFLINQAKRKPGQHG